MTTTALAIATSWARAVSSPISPPARRSPRRLSRFLLERETDGYGGDDVSQPPPADRY